MNIFMLLLTACVTHFVASHGFYNRMNQNVRNAGTALRRYSATPNYNYPSGFAGGGRGRSYRRGYSYRGPRATHRRRLTRSRRVKARYIWVPRVHVRPNKGQVVLNYSRDKNGRRRRYRGRYWYDYKCNRIGGGGGGGGGGNVEARMLQSGGGSPLNGETYGATSFRGGNDPSLNGKGGNFGGGKVGKSETTYGPTYEETTTTTTTTTTGDPEDQGTPFGSPKPGQSSWRTTG